MVAERWDGRQRETPSAEYHSDTQRKIRELEALGARMSPGIPPEVVDRIHAYEFGPRTTDLEELRASGIEVPAADGLSDDMLSRALKRVIDGLADLRVYLTGTNHLSDRALYRRLEEEILRTPHGPTDAGHGWTVIDLMGDEEHDDPDGGPAPLVDRDRTLPMPEA